MLSVEQYERISKLVQPISAMGSWLLPKVLGLLVAGVAALGVMVCYALQLWHWHYLWLLPIALFSVPVVIVGIWALLLWDLVELPEALAGLKYSPLSAKAVVADKTIDMKPAIERPAMNLSATRKLPSLLKELWGLVQGVDAVRTLVTHTIFLANPISWLLFAVSVLVMLSYAGIAIVISLFYWL